MSRGKFTNDKYKYKKENKKLLASHDHELELNCKNLWSLP